jgi:hypothetical protein
MIGDDIQAHVRDAEFQRIIGRAEWVQLPFSVFPFNPAGMFFDWTETRVPDGLIPREPGSDGVLVVDRLPFETTGLFAPDEPGALVATARYGRTTAEIAEITRMVFEAAWPGSGLPPAAALDRVDGAVVANMIGLGPRQESLGPYLPAGRSPFIQAFFFLVIRRDGERGDPYVPRCLWPIFTPLMDERTTEAEILAGLKLIYARNAYLTLKLHGIRTDPTKILADTEWWDRMTRGMTVRDIRKEWWLDTGHAALTISTASALLNAKNLRKDVIQPTQSRPSRRRGEPPPYRYHVLKIDPGRARAKSARAGGPAEDHNALHLVRGHWKVYTPESPLLGRHVGRWWWAPHLAGQAEAVVEKSYEVFPPHPPQSGDRSHHD